MPFNHTIATKRLEKIGIPVFLIQNHIYDAFLEFVHGEDRVVDLRSTSVFLPIRVMP